LVENTRRGKRITVAIIGGGCAGMAAAWQLSRQPRYEVHVYEKSWRLGGKGASVRDTDGRILDHGLHVWLGFYENAFRMMRECYDEVEKRKWGPNAEASEKLAHSRLFDDAFFPEPLIGVLRPGGDWLAWSGYFPPAKGRPGDALDEGSNPFTLVNYVIRCFDLLKTLMLSIIEAPGEDVPGQPRPQQRSRVDEAINLDFSIDTTRSLPLLIERMTGLLRSGTLIGAAVLLQAIAILEKWLEQLNFAPQACCSTWCPSTRDSVYGQKSSTSCCQSRLVFFAIAFYSTRTDSIRSIILIIASGSLSTELRESLSSPGS
jgi:hypothetical protein